MSHVGGRVFRDLRRAVDCGLPTIAEDSCLAHSAPHLQNGMKKKEVGKVLSDRQEEQDAKDG